MSLHLSTQQREIINYLRQNKTASTFEMQMQLGIVNVHMRIKELRDMGYNISCTLEDWTNKYGKKIKRGIYRIESEPKDTGE
ncbi:helix-turn-helix domain-containing protein [Kingella kingae]|uniref:helix-turn-helix domain-containing protein n=1 Tax=Kingella kingae TaxID=504 RepID=UPI0002585A63|nr:helix-turn-helix domain-containing protein [Kingella kingae]EIC13352.1 hypothetical protein KKB_07023 [Kingella kingae PYKK081]MBD3614784.1 hypothetical protein [Kingella kingae]MBD3633139.1 hypothetical protein [Kingella kingae]MBD3660451.1 hypothetical protein [Kingella kingae]MDK4545402.1 helix-turn-helix domain-containing protein [Kingella kingae]